MSDSSRGESLIEINRIQVETVRLEDGRFRMSCGMVGNCVNRE